MQKRVLILCTGNSCRSQMAEVLWRAMAGEAWQVYSAGSDPAGYVHPLAIKVLEEWGLDTQRLASKGMNEFCAAQIDLIVTVCDRAKESCPMLAGTVSHLHWPFEDPAAFAGDEADRLARFREIRNQICTKIANYLGVSAPFLADSASINATGEAT